MTEASRFAFPASLDFITLIGHWLDKCMLYIQLLIEWLAIGCLLVENLGCIQYVEYHLSPLRSLGSLNVPPKDDWNESDYAKYLLLYKQLSKFGMIAIYEINWNLLGSREAGSFA